MEKTGVSFLLGPYQNAVANALEKMRRASIAARIWACDFHVWKPVGNEITNRLGWLHAPMETLGHLRHVQSILEPLTSDGVRDVVLLGMGGSSMAADVFNRMFGSAPGFPTLHILDTTDPTVIAPLINRLDLASTLFLVSSKSGTTQEVASLFSLFYHQAYQQLGDAANGHFIVITDEGSPFLKKALDMQLLYAFTNNPRIGGRYSALSLPGVVPAAILGMNVEKLLKNATAVANREKTDFFPAGRDSAGLLLGAALGVAAQYGRDKLTLVFDPGWSAFGDWLEQLIAESTGKEGKGIIPILNEPFFDADAYAKDRLFVFFETPQTDWGSRIAELAQAGHPMIKVAVNDIYDLGGQMFLWEMAVAVASHLLGINPFDQPDVEATKEHTRHLLDPSLTVTPSSPVLTTEDCDLYGHVQGQTVTDAVRALLSDAHPSAYIAFLSYLPQTPEIQQALGELRQIIAEKYRKATTMGDGPRYLHSTGQLHKGDAGHGVFIELTCDREADIDIPGQPGESTSSLSFGRLLAAQAEGDFRALTEKGRRVLRIHCTKDAAATLAAIAKSL